MKEKRPLLITGIILIFFNMLTFSVSAFIFKQPSNSITIKLNLGNILEGQTIHYTPNNTPYLNDVLFITTTQADVYLYFDTNLDEQSNNYATYQIVIKAGDTIPFGSDYSIGDVVATLTLDSPDATSKLALDVAGYWTFDYEITTTAKSVNSNQTTNVSITVMLKVNST